jgi:hypothetical protein
MARLVVRSASPGAGDDGQLFHEKLLGLQHEPGITGNSELLEGPQRRRLDDCRGSRVMLWG